MQKELFESEYKKLNTSQQKAVDSIYWPVMVVAGPGTGKTQIIWLRTANILLQTWVNPENILITTFTEAWVIAIKKRLSKFLGPVWYKVKVTTFHSFASEVITDFPEKFLEERAKQTIDDIESYEILSEILDGYISDWVVKELFSTMDRFAYLKDIKDRISKLKSEWITPEKFTLVINDLEKNYTQKLIELENNKRIRDLEKRRQKDKETYDKHIAKLLELKLIYTQYNKKIKELWYYDFANMIQFVTNKFETDHEILAYYAEKFQFIMIDEFQDTNNSQNKIIDLILSVTETGLEKDRPVSWGWNIMVVWDDDQSIYRFQWANIENMLDFVSKYPTTQMVVLDDNYRSSQEILNLSQNVIENNTQRISNRISSINKNLKAKWDFKDKKENHFYVLENDIKEKLFVCNEIKRLESPDKTFAIIVKKNRQVSEWLEFLKQKGLQVTSKNNTTILNNHFVKFLLDFLAIVDNPYFNDEKFLNILRSDLIDIENIDVIYMARNLYQRNYSRNKFKLGIWDIIKDCEDNEYIKENAKSIEKIIAFRDFMLSLETDFWNGWITALVRNVLEKLNIFEYIEENWDFNDLQDIFTLVNKIKWYIENNKEITLKNILAKFELHNKFSLPINRDAIHTLSSNIEILTAHNSKWLEYDYVFIPEVYEWNWKQKAIPDKLKLPLWMIWEWLQFSDADEKDQKELEKEIALEEERRLFFVAMTRAKEWLIFTLPASKENKPLIQSSFILETFITPEEKDIEISEEETKALLISSMLENPLVKTTRDELDYIEKFLQNYKLSPTDLNKFLEDPKRFLREVVFRYPFLSNENLMFWSAYHRVLEIATIEKSKWFILSLSELKKIFLDEIRKYDLTPEEFQRVQERWISGLEWYYEIFTSNKRQPFATEYNFSSRQVIFEWVPLTGKIDKIEIIWASNSPALSFDWQWSLFSEQIALVDYKTWSVKTLGTIKWTDKYWEKKEGEWWYFRQLMFYKLMVENCSELKNRFSVWELALDFVEGKSGKYEYVTVQYTFEEFEYFKTELVESRKKITDIEFWKEILK